MNAWERQRALARTTTIWAATSIVGGGILALRRDPWWRSFGLQHVGWGLVDLGIIAAATGVQARRMRRLGNAFAPAALDRERRHLRTVLLVNVVADAGYVVVGGALWRRPRAAVSGGRRRRGHPGRLPAAARRLPRPGQREVSRSGERPCPCGSGQPYPSCCEPLHDNRVPAATAEQLMRSRYSAYAVGRLDHVFRTWHPRTRPPEVEPSPGLTWTGLTISHTAAGQAVDDDGVVEFEASYRTRDGSGVLRERSLFTRRAGRWLYLDGLQLGSDVG